MRAIHIPNPKLVEEKIRRIKEDTNETFHMISDFDKTLTPAFIDGKKAESGIGQLRAGGYLSPEYVREAYHLFDKYHPIEIDESIPLEERAAKMQEWWETHLHVMIRHGLNKEVIDDIIAKRIIKPREGSLTFYDLLHDHNIPLLIFSAGKGDLIEGFLRAEGKLTPNVHVIANFYDYDEAGRVRGYKSKIVHVFNKNEGQILNAPYHQSIEKRQKVLLLGDGLGDVHMTDGLHHDTILRIGFLNERIDERIDAFASQYDVVLLNDAPMDYVNTALRRILGSH